jgi:hypothetical protein
MEHAETRLSKVTMMSLSDNPVWGELRSAVQKYGLEGIEWYQRYMETPVAPLY